jgi:Protein of unknown function (DUF3551)
MSTEGRPKSRRKKMSKIYKTAAAAAMAVSAATLLVMAAPASAAPHRAAVGYCLQYGYGGSDCSFTSKAQCEATASGEMAECYRNDYGKEGETLHW